MRGYLSPVWTLRLVILCIFLFFFSPLRVYGGFCVWVCIHRCTCLRACMRVRVCTYVYARVCAFYAYVRACVCVRNALECISARTRGWQTVALFRANKCTCACVCVYACICACVYVRAVALCVLAVSIFLIALSCWFSNGFRQPGKVFRKKF